MDKYQASELNRIAKKRMMMSPSFSLRDVGWAKVLVEAEHPIPEAYRELFYDELVSENLEYRKELEESVRWFGVRWKKEF